MSADTDTVIPRHPVIVAATGQEERRGYAEKMEGVWHHTVSSFRSEHGPSLHDLIDALIDLNRDLNAGELTVIERAELSADFDDVAALIGRKSHPVHCWAVVTTYDPNGTFKPGQDVVWSGHLTQADAEAALPRWDRHLNRGRDNIRVEWRTDVQVTGVKTSDWKGPRR